MLPANSEINHPELEPELCAFLREIGVPACDFLKNTEGIGDSSIADFISRYL